MIRLDHSDWASQSNDFNVLNFWYIKPCRITKLKWQCSDQFCIVGTIFKPWVLFGTKYLITCYGVTHIISE